MPGLVVFGALVAVAGIALILLATVLARRDEEGARGGEEGGKERARVRGGGVIMIGPIPIIVGSDAKWTVVAMVLAILLIVLSFLLGRAA